MTGRARQQAKAAATAWGSMPEDDLEFNVVDTCKKLRLRTAHFRPALTKDGRWITPVAGDGKGWPDWVIVGPGGALFRELKSQTGTVKPEQQVWLDVLTAAGLDAGVWRPDDWRSGRILAELKAIRRPRTAPAQAI